MSFFSGLNVLMNRNEVQKLSEYNSALILFSQ